VGRPYEGDVAAFWTLVDGGEPAFRQTAFDVEAAVADVRASGWPAREEFVRDHLLAAPTRAQAIEQFERMRTG
jgi:hypothetical protein